MDFRLNVLYKGETKNVKTDKNPQRRLIDLHTLACQHFRVNPRHFSLFHRGKELDLSQAVKAAGLTTNALVDLKECNLTSRVGKVALKIMGPGGGRRENSFRLVSTSLWDLLLRFEKEKGDTTGLETEKPFRMPRLRWFSWRSNGSLQQLVETTLADIGLRSGTAMFELTFEKTSLSFEEVSQTISSLKESLDHPSPSPSSSSSNSSPSPSSMTLDSNPLPSPPPLPSSSSSSSDVVMEDPVETKIEKEKEKEKEKEEGGAEMKISFDPMKPMIFSNFDDVKMIHDMVPTQQKRVDNPRLKEGVCINVERKREIYRSNKEYDPSSYDFHLPDSFYSPSVEDVARPYVSPSSGPSSSSSSSFKNPVPKQTLPETTTLRIKFQDQTTLQGNFGTWEKGEAVYSFVKESLAITTVPFSLFSTPPKKELKEQMTLSGHGVGASQIFYIQGKGDGQQPSLKTNLLADAPSLPTQLDPLAKAAMEKKLDGLKQTAEGGDIKKEAAEKKRKEREKETGERERQLRERKERERKLQQEDQGSSTLGQPKKYPKW
eukprot:CAMPEP_0201486534 /NCGR_PEP_ID=MMETSP0151_2-20130828/10598_1 /ASSEMBLY_ACC=CAM_ASM_000257 /TAXON_ID=200890 /ORGANISM="Paramoeba atlantica, Strain 621/1 / CCAP 1560/9" /LENGTH=545 /DNA_ID=CAMNT_0047871225 /DNA_START=123 /DNA_END=1757 /DNA_ORIENTATION=-